MNKEFQVHFQNQVLHETSYTQKPQQNGVVKWKNKQILEIARALLIGAHVPS